MNREQKIRAAMLICAAVLVAVVGLALSGIFRGGIGGTVYADADKYTAGDAEITGTVRSLSVDWLDGKVRVERHAESTVLLKETSKKALDQSDRLHWYLDGETLKIHYAASGRESPWNLDKELTVTLPEGVRLESAAMTATSADFLLPELEAEKISLTVTSGDIQAQGLSAADLSAVSTSGSMELSGNGFRNVLCVSTSGNVRLETDGGAENISLQSTSGGLSLRAGGETGSLSMNSTSGNLDADLKSVKRVSASSTSGTIRVQAGGEKADLSLKSTSGNVTAVLPSAPGFTAKISTVSGDLSSGIAMEKNGKDYTCGDGSGRLEISTTSGDVRISELNP